MINALDEAIARLRSRHDSMKREYDAEEHDDPDLLQLIQDIHCVVQFVKTFNTVRNTTWMDVTLELIRALEMYPHWPCDPLHAFAVLGEEVGELQKAVLQQVYEPEKTNPDAVRAEAIQTAAMAFRFLMGLHNYVFVKSVEFRQLGEIHE